jgi:hypothetical protein
LECSSRAKWLKLASAATGEPLPAKAVAEYLRYPLSYPDSEETFRERAFAIDHSTIYRWV